MLDHADRQLARLIAFLEQTDMLANTIVIVTSDNGASQEGGPLGFVNCAGPRNFRTEPFSEKLARIDEIGGPKTPACARHSPRARADRTIACAAHRTDASGSGKPFIISGLVYTAKDRRVTRIRGPLSQLSCTGYRSQSDSRISLWIRT